MRIAEIMSTDVSTATAATFAKSALPEMLRRGYAPGFSAGTIAAGEESTRVSTTSG